MERAEGETLKENAENAGKAEEETEGEKAEQTEGETEMALKTEGLTKGKKERKGKKMWRIIISS